MTETRLLDQETIKKMLTMDKVNEIVEKTFQEVGERRVKNPTKVTLDLGNNSDWPEYEGYMNAMPAYIGGLDVAGLKWVGGFDGKRKEAGYPYINGLILLIDPQLGTFKAVMDGTLITNLRTGAQTAVAIKYLGFEKGADLNLALFGTGMQASMQLHAIADWFNIKHVNLWHYHDKGVKEFIAEHEDLVDGDIDYVTDVKEACDADIVITATKSQEALLDYQDVSGDTVIIPIGSGHEIGNHLINYSDHIVVDHIGQALHRGALADAATKSIIDEDDIDATIGQLASGRLTLPGLRKGTTICVPIGIGALDIAIAGQLAKEAEAENIGSTFSFNPY
ncbi:MULTISPECIES: ornithine cyclodeaminase family protein [Aerococcus]|uniref:Ornithine cyclodeaminase family protein n=2 Tax=Aerococcus TaxID=1375 RepID=A0A178HJP3_9LACT|nr:MULTISPECIES: ornithine cyclodeaminase family protein [Aerococcus]KAA9218457.1 ornithine cyclodeaminase family protein [Aerococcus loyolae]KAA9264920.1 ornithine cyclodeaminase family protein [Aerococcus loyolae]MCY3025970.1 ornithine cyclodeaminase family protein [Aerococcus loyolae]MCY3028128.1 ornithine cyclodeaminase family protein [Aerococcus loyolae]MCY3029773.1 ornithine cyclodeaminase family protein [Aerococcus loyolae]